MKKLVILFVSALVLFTGCNKDFHSIFDGSDKEVISPVDLTSVGIKEDIPQLLAKDVLKKIYGEELSYNGKRCELAHVINDPSMLVPIEDGGYEYKWPEIDFSKYSLVIGQYFDVGEGLRLSTQRAKISGKKAKIYLKLEPVGGPHPQTTMWYYFAAIYSKLPDGPAEVEVLRSYDK